MDMHFFGLLFDVISGAWIIAKVYHPPKSIQAVSDGDIQRFTKYVITLTRVGDDLSVPAGNVEHDWITGARDLSAHLDIWFRYLGQEGPRLYTYCSSATYDRRSGSHPRAVCRTRMRATSATNCSGAPMPGPIIHSQVQVLVQSQMGRTETCL